MTQAESQLLSARARALPEILRNLAKYGMGPFDGGVMLAASQLMELADAAQELADAAGVPRL